MHKCLMLFALVCLSGCGGDTGTAASNSPTASGEAPVGQDFEFHVEDSDGRSFSQASQRASVGWVRGSMIDLRASGYRISIDARGLPETGPGSTTELGFNNTSYSFPVDGSGRPRVSCKPSDPEKGSFDRTEYGDDRISGSFEVEFVRCTDGMTGQPVEVEGLPLTVRARFRDLQLTD